MFKCMYVFMRIEISLVVAMLGISSLSDGSYHFGDGNSTSNSTSFHFSGRDQTSYSLSMHPFALAGECKDFLKCMYVCMYVCMCCM